MPIHNSDIARLFNRMADLLEIQNANPFRVRAYRTAALTINGLSRDITEMVKAGEDLTELPGIGEDLAKKIQVIIKTGKFPQLQTIEKRVPAVLSELMRIENLGPKRVKILYKKLHLKSMKDLETALKQGKVRKLRGFGEKTEQRIKAGIFHLREYQKQWLLAEVIPIVNALTTYLKKIPAVQEIECAGSYRRKKGTVGDLDFLITTEKAKSVMQHFIKYDEVAEVLAQGKTRSTVRLHSGIQVDLRVVSQISYGAALFYFTGSKAHNIAIRQMAIKKKLKVNEYGVFKGKRSLVSKTEREVYAAVDLPYIEPELRENRGEIQAAKKHQLPKLIQLKDIRGDLHCHTNATDGTASLEVMAKAAADKGYEYLAITDHSKHLAMVHGLDKKTLLQQIKKIDQLNAKLKNIVILKSIELDILEDGSLDLPDDILKELDLTVCSIHSKFNLSLKKQTERIIRAMDNPFFNILAHPTGRLINKRQQYQIDLEKIMQSAKQRDCILEINGQPDRLDLSDIHCQRAKDLGIKLAISSDAHSINQLNFMSFGIDQARRGWLEKNDVINTYNLIELKKILKRN